MTPENLAKMKRLRRSLYRQGLNAAAALMQGAIDITEGETK